MLSAASPREVLDYWFGPLEDSAAYRRERGKLWFGGAPSTDDEIRARFEPSVQAAAAGDLNSWREEPHSALALVLLLDQFPLNIYRNQAQAYRLGDLAVPMALYALEQDFLRGLHPCERAFFYLPLEHAENLALQDRCVELYALEYEGLKGTNWEKWAKGNYDFALRHQKVVREFGRFPHRNEALGRVSTEAELAFLAKGAPY